LRDEVKHVLVDPMLVAKAALTAQYVLEYTYRRSVGPLLGRFLAGLRDGRIMGARTTDGRVLVPPSEYAPDTGEAVEQMVEVGQAGEVVAWSWVETPSARLGLAGPFAWALVKLDGADTAMLHAVDAGSPERMHSGVRVQARWRPERTGHIADIACFELEAAR
jgi:uncharacterized protein